MPDERALDVEVMVLWPGGGTGVVRTRVEIATGPRRRLHFTAAGVSVDLQIEGGATGRIRTPEGERVPALGVDLVSAEVEVAGVPRAATHLRLRVRDPRVTTRLVAVEILDVLFLDPALMTLLAEPEDPAADVDEAAFTELFVEILAARRPEAKVTSARPLEVRLDPPGTAVNLHNLWSERPRGRRALAEALVKRAELVLEVPGQGDRDAILPVVRHARIGAAVPNLVTRPLVGDIVVTYVFDRPDTMRFLVAADLERLGLDADALHALALTNLDRALPLVERHGPDARFMLVCGGTYESSAVLLPDVLGAAGADDLSVFVASRDLVLVAPMSDAAGRASHAEIAARVVRDGNYTVSATELRWQRGVWSLAPARPPVDTTREVSEEGGNLAVAPRRWRLWPLPSTLALTGLFYVASGPARVFAELLSAPLPVLYALTYVPVVAAWFGWRRLDEVRPVALHRRDLRLRRAALVVYAVLAAVALALHLLGIVPPDGTYAASVGGLAASLLLAGSELLDTRDAERAARAGAAGPAAAA